MKVTSQEIELENLNSRLKTHLDLIEQNVYDFKKKLDQDLQEISLRKNNKPNNLLIDMESNLGTSFYELMILQEKFKKVNIYYSHLNNFDEYVELI